MSRRATLPPPAATADVLRRRGVRPPRLGIVLGSGFGGVADAIDARHTFEFRDLPGFPVGSAPGHRQRLLLGNWHGIEVAILQGRAHLYEGFDPSEVVFPIRVLAALGIGSILLTNAAGGIAPRLRVGDFLGIADHINLTGSNPLRGPVPPGLERFVDLTAAYDPELLGMLRTASRRARARFRTGIYLAVSGPSFETPAEIRAFRRLGADAVGMSTVPEVIAARQHGLRVAGLSCITNAAAGLGGPDQVVSADEVLAVAATRSAAATALVSEFVRQAARTRTGG